MPSSSSPPTHYTHMDEPPASPPPRYEGMEHNRSSSNYNYGRNSSRFSLASFDHGSLGSNSPNESTESSFNPYNGDYPFQASQHTFGRSSSDSPPSVRALPPVPGVETAGTTTNGNVNVSSSSPVQQQMSPSGHRRGSGSDDSAGSIRQSRLTFSAPSDDLHSHDRVGASSSRAASSSPRSERRDSIVGGITTLYSFSYLSHNSMILALAEAPTLDQRRAAAAKYHISVSMNCFIPGISYIITIRRGGTEDGDDVGEIELGNPEHKDKGGTVRIGNTRLWLSKVLKKGPGSHKMATWSWKQPWSWEFGDQCTLLWNCTETERKCYKANYTGNGREQTPLVASFNPPHTYGEDVVSTVPPTLRTSTSNQSTLDHILISSLLLERRRLLGLM